MNGNVRKLKDRQGSEFFPVAHASGTFMEDGSTVQEKVEGISSDLAEKTNLTNERIDVQNSAGDTTGIVDFANFAGQGTGTNPTGVVMHNYTDGVCVQVDNVGDTNNILVLKNANNAEKRPDKDPAFVGTGNFLKLEKNGVGSLLIFDQNADMNWLSGNKKAIIKNSRPENTSDASFQIDSANYNKYILALASIGQVKVYFMYDNSAQTVSLQTPSAVTGGLIFQVVKGDCYVNITEAGKGLKVKDPRDGNIKYVQSVNTATTAGRPTDTLRAGEMWFDTTLNKPIWRNAANDGWVDATGATV